MHICEEDIQFFLAFHSEILWNSTPYLMWHKQGRSCIYLEKLRSHIDIGIQDDRYYDQGCTPFHKADNICDSPHDLIKLRDASPLDHPNYQRLSKISNYLSHFRFRVEYYTHTFGLPPKYHCCRGLNVQDYEQQNICTRIEIQCPSLP
jgi:hypothetical protein